MTYANSAIDTIATASAHHHHHHAAGVDLPLSLQIIGPRMGERKTLLVSQALESLHAASIRQAF
jgi:Asp-tRNA(Asn)/Glu-tRNA(Gln) amidotransferase A subunit family amidase